MSTPELIYLRDGGTVCSFSAPLPHHVAARLDKGDLVRVNPDGSAWLQPGEPETADKPLPDGAPALPKRTASRAVWQQFAVSQGMDHDEAARMTKAELIAKFTKDE